MRYFFLISLLFGTHFLLAQNPGCTDPQAVNYNAAANVNNGSCTYNEQLYNPPFIDTLGSKLFEISGMIYFNNKILALNDGGGGNKLYMLDTATAKITQTITVDGTTNVDWEDLAQDSDFVYVGDVGNNANGNRTNLVVYKIDKKAFMPNGDFTIPASAVEKIQFKYEDQDNFTATGANKTRFDCEAITVLRGQLHLFTKNWIGNYSVHYVLPLTAGNYTAKKLDSLNTAGYLITGVDAGAYDELLFTAYNKIASCALYVVYGFGATDSLLKTGNKRQIPLPSMITLGQLESVCFVNGTHGFLASERFKQSIFNAPNQLYRFKTDRWIIDYYEHNPILSEKGMLRYNKTTDKYEVFTGVLWESLN